MKRIALIVLLLFSVLYSKEPSWYMKPPIEDKLVSTGQSSNVYKDIAKKEAIKSAIIEIARFLKISIKGVDRFSQEFVDNSYKLEYSSYTLSETDVLLKKVSLENCERVGNVTYVRMSLDTKYIDNENALDALYSSSSAVSTIFNVENEKEREKRQKIESAFMYIYGRKLNEKELYKLSKIVDVDEHDLVDVIDYLTNNDIGFLF